MTGSGYTPAEIITVAECNPDPAQPVVQFLGMYLPVSCREWAGLIANTGDFRTGLRVIQGTVGPLTNLAPTCTEGITPIPGCSTSGDATTDAEAFPCPPTPAQVLAGDQCEVVASDLSGNSASGTLSFTSPFTVLSASLSDGTTTGTLLLDTPGTPVTDSASLFGATSATSGTVTYSVYSDNTCSTQIASGGTVAVTKGVVPPSSTVMLDAAGTYYWEASYSGDGADPGGVSGCGSELEIVQGFGIITPAQLPGATRGQSYHVFVQATGASLPYTWRRTSGQLPAGLSILRFGLRGEIEIAGTPKRADLAGTYTFTLQVKSYGARLAPAQTATRTFALNLG